MMAVRSRRGSWHKCIYCNYFPVTPLCSLSLPTVLTLESNRGVMELHVTCCTCRENLLIGTEHHLVLVNGLINYSGLLITFLGILIIWEGCTYWLYSFTLMEIEILNVADGQDILLTE